MRRPFGHHSSEREKRMSDKFEDVAQRIHTYWTEVFPVERGLRSTGIIEVPDGDVPFFEDFLKSRNLSYIMITADALNQERKKRNQDPLRDYYAENLFYIGDEMRKVKTLLECDYNNDFFCVGMMLGYPDCCVASILQRGTESVDIQKLKGKFTMISHIPCSENCQRSAEYDRRLQDDKAAFLKEKAAEAGAG